MEIESQIHLPQRGRSENREAVFRVGGSEVVKVARAWLGTPYIHQASVKGAGCDCLGLLRGIWRELHGAEPETPPAYAPDWAETGRDETLYRTLARHLRPVALDALEPGDVVLFRMVPRGPAKHCGILGADAAGAFTLIHARQNRRVSEEPFTAAWRRKLAHAFRLQPVRANLAARP